MSLKNLCIFLSLLCTNHFYGEENDVLANRISMSVNELVRDWLPTVYDRHSYGFKKYPTDAFPNVESTSQVVVILKRLDLLRSLTKKQKLCFAEYFYESETHSNYQDGVLSDRDFGRHINFAEDALRLLLGENKMNPQAKIQGAKAEPPSYLTDEEALKAWLLKLDWSSPWVVGDRLQAIYQIIRRSSNKAELEAVLFSALDEKRSRLTGLWGDDKEMINSIYISGAAKIFSILDVKYIDRSHLELILKNVNMLLDTQQIKSIYELKNVIWLCESISAHSSDFSRLIIDSGVHKKIAIAVLEYQTTDKGFLVRRDKGYSNTDAAEQAVYVYMSYLKIINLDINVCTNLLSWLEL